MIVLALDSTAVAASVALCDDEKMLASYTVCIGNTHSETLLPMVESVLRTAHLTPDDIDLFACSVGPGSFTGVRIGVATVKGLAFGKEKPCVAVSTLEALAYNLVGFEGIACPVMNARRSQVYNALFEVNTKEVRRLTPDRAVSIEDLAAELANETRPIHFCGDGYELMREGLAQRVISTPAVLIPENACSVAVCALAKYRAGESVTDVALTPVYLRLSQAERERIEKEQKNQQDTGI